MDTDYDMVIEIVSKMVNLTRTADELDMAHRTTKGRPRTTSFLTRNILARPTPI